MKRFNWLLIGLVVLCLTMIPLAGCGVSKSEYEALQAEQATLLEENTSLKAELEEVQSDFTNAQATIDTLQSDLGTAQEQLNILQAENEDLQDKYPPKPFPSGEALQTWLHNDDISERGISADAVVWYSRGLELQTRAAEDGYMISVDLTETEPGYYLITCLAVVEDNGLWWWDPETDEVYYWLNTKHF